MCGRHIRTKTGRTNEWKCPGKKQVVASSVNLRQVVIALTGGELLYFELDAVSGELQEVERKETGHEIAAVDVAPIPAGRLRQRFLAVGGGSDNTVRILSLDPEDCLQVTPSMRLMRRCSCTPCGHSLWRITLTATAC